MNNTLTHPTTQVDTDGTRFQQVALTRPQLCSVYREARRRSDRLGRHLVQPAQCARLVDGGQTVIVDPAAPGVAYCTGCAQAVLGLRTFRVIEQPQVVEQLPVRRRLYAVTAAAAFAVWPTATLIAEVVTWINS